MLSIMGLVNGQHLPQPQPMSNSQPTADNMPETDHAMGGPANSTAIQMAEMPGFNVPQTEVVVTPAVDAAPSPEKQMGKNARKKLTKRQAISDKPSLSAHEQVLLNWQQQFVANPFSPELGTFISDRGVTLTEKTAVLGHIIEHAALKQTNTEEAARLQALCSVQAALAFANKDYVTALNADGLAEISTTDLDDKSSRDVAHYNTILLQDKREHYPPRFAETKRELIINRLRRNWLAVISAGKVSIAMRLWQQYLGLMQNPFFLPEAGNANVSLTPNQDQVCARDVLLYCKLLTHQSEHVEDMLEVIETYISSLHRDWSAADNHDAEHMIKAYLMTIIKSRDIVRYNNLMATNNVLRVAIREHIVRVSHPDVQRRLAQQYAAGEIGREALHDDILSLLQQIHRIADEEGIESSDYYVPTTAEQLQSFFRYDSNFGSQHEKYLYQFINDEQYSISAKIELLQSIIPTIKHITPFHWRALHITIAELAILDGNDELAHQIDNTRLFNDDLAAEMVDKPFGFNACRSAGQRWCTIGGAQAGGSFLEPSETIRLNGRDLESDRLSRELQYHLKRADIGASLVAWDQQWQRLGDLFNQKRAMSALERNADELFQLLGLLSKTPGQEREVLRVLERYSAIFMLSSYKTLDDKAALLYLETVLEAGLFDDFESLWQKKQDGFRYAVFSGYNESLNQLCAKIFILMSEQATTVQQRLDYLNLAVRYQPNNEAYTTQLKQAKNDKSRQEILEAARPYSGVNAWSKPGTGLSDNVLSNTLLKHMISLGLWQPEPSEGQESENQGEQSRLHKRARA